MKRVYSIECAQCANLVEESEILKVSLSLSVPVGKGKSVKISGYDEEGFCCLDCFLKYVKDHATYDVEEIEGEESPHVAFLDSIESRNNKIPLSEAPASTDGVAVSTPSRTETDAA